MIYSIYHYDNALINQDIQRLYRDIFHVEMEDEFQWRFIQNPQGKAISVIARFQPDGVVAGHFSAMPCRVNLRGNKIDALISMGMMVSNQYAGQGIGTVMSDYLFRHLEGDKYDLIIGFPNENSFHMHINKMGYIHVRDYHFVTFSNQHNKNRQYYTELPSGFNIEEAPGDNKMFSLDREPKYLKWRYGREKYTAFISDREEVFIITRFQDKIDIVYWTPTATVQDIRDFADFVYHNFKAQAVAAWDTLNFRSKECTVDPRKYHFCIKKLKKDLPEEILNGNEWIWLMGDSELF